MASDSDASRRKHRRSSSDDESEKSSKRRKHRHHHHRHRHYRSKHGEDTKQGGDEIVPATLPPPVPFANSNRADNDDVEEGEILEEEGSGGIDVEADELHEQVQDSQNLVCSDCPLLSLFLCKLLLFFLVLLLIWSLRNITKCGILILNSFYTTFCSSKYFFL